MAFSPCYSFRPVLIVGKDYFHRSMKLIRFRLTIFCPSKKHTGFLSLNGMVQIVLLGIKKMKERNTLENSYLKVLGPQQMAELRLPVQDYLSLVYR